jgi:hypothetical protein
MDSSHYAGCGGVVIAVLLGIIRFLILLFIVRLALRFLAGLIRSGAQGSRPIASGVDMVRDRMCNTFVPRDRALHAVLAGREEHFCSAACRDRALARATSAS